MGQDNRCVYGLAAISVALGSWIVLSRFIDPIPALLVVVGVPAGLAVLGYLVLFWLFITTGGRS